jgi:hypothetical protein
MATYFVKTEKGTYNSVNSVRHFIHTVRPNNMDFTKIIEVFKCEAGKGWSRIDPVQWVENNS